MGTAARLASVAAILLRPAAAWPAVRAANPRWGASLLGYALPLALLPSVAWPLGQGLGIGSFVATLAFSLASVLLLAAAAYLLAPFFDTPRHWDRSMALAAYASTPVMLCGALLVVPVLVVASIAGFIHCLALYYSGLQGLLGCRERDAAAFTAAAAMLAFLGSMLLGGLCSAAGLI